ncbi:helix-turn-helix domain-containing protein [Escherichia coli]|nr:helix-turn-helix domain-containing protein [Escherichia coli]
MANNSFGDVFNPQFERLIQYTFDKPVATTIANKKTGKTKERFNLDLVEVTIYGKMAGFHLNGKEIFISEQTLAKICGVSDRKIIESIKTLENAGLISVVKSKGKSNHYKLLITPSQVCKMCDAQGIQPMSNAGGEDKQSQEAHKTAPQQPEKPEAMQSPSQPKKERRERRRDAGKPKVDEHGYPVLTSDEMNDRWKIVRDTFKDKKSIKLSELRDTFYGPEVMDKIKGTIPDKIWKEEDYWHLTEQALKVAQHVFKRGKTITIDYISHGYDAPRERLWNNCKLVNGELTITK